MDRDLAFTLLASLATRAPSLIAEIVGVVVAIVHLRSHRNVAVLALIGFSLLLVMTLVVTPLAVMLPFWLHQSGRSITDIGRVEAVVSIATDLVYAGCIGLLIGAIFGWRREAQQ